MVTEVKSDCTGCGACYSACPKKCISMEQDAEGFLYPAVDSANCTKCGKCEKICPAMSQGTVRKPLKVYAAKNPDEEIRYQSSSGGVFSMLAESVIAKGGVVFGARFNDNWEVEHGYAETVEGLAAFRGSKYVQSVIGETYKQTKEFLENGRRVLYSGTPCQIAGLKAYLSKDYDNLLAVDLVCHGVPSPLVWKKYLGEIIGISPHAQNITTDNNKFSILDIRFRDKIYGWNSLLIFSILTDNGKPMDMQGILNIKFRNKKNGWKCKHITVSSTGNGILLTQDSNRNSFMRGFLRNLYLRPSCYKCPARPFKSGSDITIGDYWGIGNVLPEFDDDKGVSLVMVNTEKGGDTYGLLEKENRETVYADALAGNLSIEKSALPHGKRGLFFERLHGEPVIPLIDGLTADPFGVRLRKTAAAVLRGMGIYGFVKSLLRK